MALPKGFVNHSKYQAPEDIKRLAFICEAVKDYVRPGGQVLDVGCGNGNIAYQMGALGYKVLAIDMSADSIAKAQEVNGHPNVEFRVTPAEAVDPALKFNAIICSEVIEHLTDPDTVVKTLKGMLAPEGALIITVPNGWGPREFLVTRPMQFLLTKNNLMSKIVIGLKRMMGYRGYTPQSSSGDLTHLQFFTKADLLKMYEKNGLKMVRFGHINFIEKVFPFSLVFRYSRTLQWLDCNVADVFPHYFTSGFTSVTEIKK